MGYRCRARHKVIHPLFQGLATLGLARPELQLFLWDFVILYPLCFFLCLLFSRCLLLPSLWLISFLLFLCASLGDDSCTSSTFSIAILNGTCFYCSVSDHLRFV